MNLAIDIGNTSWKAGVYDEWEKKHIMHAVIDDGGLVNKMISDYPVDKAIISTVRKNDPEIFRKELNKKDIQLIILNHNTSLPFVLNYKSPESLGADRIAAVASAFHRFHKKNILVIDAGTAVTFDLINEKGEYLGGNISPGLNMRFRALNRDTGRLPLLSRDNSYNLIGNSTHEAIRAGVQSGLIFEINDYIRKLKMEYRQLKVLITGGDGIFVAENIDETDYELAPDLVIDGLNYILNYNV